MLKLIIGHIECVIICASTLTMESYSDDQDESSL